MSYCRLSDDNFGCDVYAYDSINGGIDIHVADSRYLGDIPKIDITSIDTLVSTRLAQNGFIRRAETKPIGLSRDGASYYGLSRCDAVSMLISLKKEGYRVPDNAIIAIQGGEDDDANKVQTRNILS